jgi:hypothetical protein
VSKAIDIVEGIAWIVIGFFMLMSLYTFDNIGKRLETVEYNSVLNTEQISACCSAMDFHAGDSSQHILFVEVLK